MGKAMLSGGMIGVLTTVVVALILCGAAALIFWIVFGSDFESSAGGPRAAKRSGFYLEVLGFGILAVLASSVLFFLSLRNAERVDEPPPQVAAVAPLPAAPAATPSEPIAPAPAPLPATLPAPAPSASVTTAPIPTVTPPPIPTVAAPPSPPAAPPTTPTPTVAAPPPGPPVATGPAPSPAAAPAPSAPVATTPTPGPSPAAAAITEIEPAAGPSEPPLSASPGPGAPPPSVPTAEPTPSAAPSVAAAPAPASPEPGVARPPSPPASAQTASVPPAAGQVSTPAANLEIDILMLRGDALRRTGDVVAARLFYERAAEEGSAAAARAVGETYDPLVLEEERVRGVRGDQIKAIDWYRKAILGGDAAAVDRMHRLITQTSG